MRKNIFAALLGLVASLFNLTAQAVEVKNFEEVYKEKCDAISGGSFGDDWCYPGNAEGKMPNLVLIGDSYSNSLNGMMESYASSNKTLFYEQYGRGQCPLLLGYGPDWCTDFAQTVYQRVKKTPSIKTVVIAGNWSYYWTEKKKFSATSRDYLRGEFEKSLKDTLKAYQALGKRVVFVYQSPGLGDPKQCVQRRIRLGNAAEDKCQLSLAEAQTREEYRGFVMPLLAQLKVPALDPYLYFCDTKSCKVRDGDKIFNTTTTHLSGFGGQYLARKAAPELKKLLTF